MKCKEIQEKEKVNLLLKNKKKQKLKEKGITLIALVVTIIILLILVGVTLNMALSGDGLFNMARKAATDYNQKAVEEKLQLMYAEKIMENNNSNSNVKADVTSVLEEMTGGEITENDIEEFNKLLEQYNEEVKGIKNAEELGKIGTNEEYPIDGVYVQLNDIELLKTQIGSEDNPFKGVYNGNGKSIKKLEITATEDYTGMFRANEGTVKNVTIEDCQITSEKGIVGGIAGKNKGSIENCIVFNGSITSNGLYTNHNGVQVSGNVGGICGYFENGIIQDCNNSAIVTGLYNDVGGICGNSYGSIVNCFNNGKVTGPYCVGGIVGNLAIGGKCVSCENDGEIIGVVSENVSNNACGGIVGYMRDGSSVDDCKNRGSIHCDRPYAGGISGIMRDYCSILSSSNEGQVQRN